MPKIEYNLLCESCAAALNYIVYKKVSPKKYCQFCGKRTAHIVSKNQGDHK
jgi:ribosomal protein L33